MPDIIALAMLVVGVHTVRAFIDRACNYIRDKRHPEIKQRKEMEENVRKLPLEKKIELFIVLYPDQMLHGSESTRGARAVKKFLDNLEDPRPSRIIVIRDVSVIIYYDDDKIRVFLPSEKRKLTEDDESSDYWLAMSPYYCYNESLTADEVTGMIIIPDALDRLIVMAKGAIDSGAAAAECWLTADAGLDYAAIEAEVARLEKEMNATPANEAFSVPKFKKGGFLDKYTTEKANKMAKAASRSAEKKYGEDFRKRINARIKEILNSGKSNEAICQEAVKLMVGSKRYMHGEMGKQMAEANCARMKKKCKVAKVCNVANLYYVYVETEDGEAAIYIPFAGGKQMERMAMHRVANEIASYEILQNHDVKVMESYNEKAFNEGSEPEDPMTDVRGDLNTVGPLIDQYVVYVKDLYFLIENGKMTTQIATPAEAKANIESYCAYPKKDPNVSTPPMKCGTYPYSCKVEHGLVTHVVIPVSVKDAPMGIKLLPINQVINDLRNTIGVDQKYGVHARKRAICEVMTIFKELMEREKYACLAPYASEYLKVENMKRIDDREPEGITKFMMGGREADLGEFDFTSTKDRAQALTDLMCLHFYPEARKAFAKSSSGNSFVLHMHCEGYRCCFDLATMEYYQEGVAPYDHFEEEFGGAQESIFNMLFR